MLENYDIVCFGPSDWWGMNPSCATHIMRNLAATNRIVYINPISSDLSGIRSRKGLHTRVVRKTMSLLKFVRRVDRNLYVFSAFFLPFQGEPILDRVNDALFNVQLRLLLLFLQMKRPLLWVENVRAADFIEGFHWRLVLYHVSDRFGECPYTRNKDKLLERESFVTTKSDLIICVSRKLYEAKRKTRRNVYYLPHGVDFSVFRQTAENGETYEGLSHVCHPIAGYFGTLTAQNDIELLTYCAANLPDVNFVFAGRITAGDYGKLTRLKNVVFLSQVAYKEVPRLCATFDVCLLPWKMTKWIVSCNPLKLFEYMASGKPIVSVPISEVLDNYSDILSVRSSKKEFCQAIRWELENDTKERKQKRIAIAQANSWKYHNRRLSDIIQAV